MAGVKDKRKIKRRRLIYYLRVYSLPAGELLGHLVDITPAGLLIVGERLLPFEQDYDLQMDLPTPIQERESLHFKARCIWSRKDPAPTFFASGFEFTLVDPLEREIIDLLIQNFGYYD